MAEVKILVKGYAKEQGNSEFASSTTTLIREKELNIIVDPGMNRKLLLESLKKEGLSLSNINYVILTHYHLDHSLLTGIFENAKILDNIDAYSFDGKIEKYEEGILGTNIKIIKTPGHDMFHCSILINDKELGRVVVAGDVFWWSDEEEQKTDKESLMNHEDPYVKNKKELINSRKKIIKLADWIIPGHGDIFEVKK